MNDERKASLALLKRQRSHILFVLSEPQAGQQQAFLEWYQRDYPQALRTTEAVLSVQHYERHEVDITRGRHAPLPFQYLGMHEISVDGAEAAASVIDRIATLHQAQPAARAPATWLYYPASEKAGRSPKTRPSLLTLAFANPLPGQESEFREWYATRHIRHALNIGALVSGQCFERTLFQKPGAMEAKFATIAVYEQEGPPEAILEAFASLPPDTFRFPMMDGSRFAESVYRLI